MGWVTDAPETAWHPGINRLGKLRVIAPSGDWFLRPAMKLNVSHGRGRGRQIADVTEVVRVSNDGCRQICCERQSPQRHRHPSTWSVFDRLAEEDIFRKERPRGCGGWRVGEEEDEVGKAWEQAGLQTSQRNSAQCCFTSTTPRP